MKFHSFANKVLKPCCESLTLEMVACPAPFLWGDQGLQDPGLHFRRSEEMEGDVRNVCAAEQKRMPETQAKRTWDHGQTSHYLLSASVSTSVVPLRFHTDWYSTAVGPKLYLQHLTITSDIHLRPQCFPFKIPVWLENNYLTLEFISKSHEISQSMDFNIISNRKWTFRKSFELFGQGKITGLDNT